MEKTTPFYQKALKAILDYLLFSGDEVSPEQLAIRAEKKKRQAQVTKPKIQEKPKHGTVKGLVTRYVIFSLPFIFIVIQHYYQVKRGDLDAGIALLFMACGMYTFFTSSIANRMHNLIPLIIKIHMIFVLAFGVYGAVILVSFIAAIINNSLRFELAAAFVMFVVMMSLLVFTYRLLKKATTDFKPDYKNIN